MKELEHWQELLKKYNKAASKYLSILERQLQHLQEDDVDKFMSLFDKKRRATEKMSRLTPELKSYKEKFLQDEDENLPSPYGEEIQRLRRDNIELLRTSHEKLKELEKLIEKHKNKIGKELSKLKQDRKVAISYHPDPNFNGEEGVFFDKKS